MLHAGEALGGVVVFIVNVDIVVAHGVASFFGEEVVVDEGFCGLARKFHHHAGRRVGIHIGVFACYVGVFCLDDFSEDVGSLGTSCNAALVAVGDVALGNLFSRAVHEFDFDHILNFFYGHTLRAEGAYAVCYTLNQTFVLAEVGGKHCLAYCGFYFFFIIADDASVALDYCVYHQSMSK